MVDEGRRQRRNGVGARLHVELQPAIGLLNPHLAVTERPLARRYHPERGLPCTMPKPLTMPFTAILPKGPASKTSGGIPASGPVMEGVGSGAGAAGAAAGAAGAAGGVAAWPAACGVGAGVAGAFCARQTEVNPKQRAITARFFPRNFHDPPPLANC